MMTLGEALDEVLPRLGRELRIHANGHISRAACTRRDDEGCFYMIGSMGLASSIALTSSVRTMVGCVSRMMRASVSISSSRV